MVKRRTFSLTLIVLGGVLMFLAPEEAPWAGAVLIVSGLLLEAAGWWIEARKGREGARPSSSPAGKR